MSTNLESPLNDAAGTQSPAIDIRYGQVGLLQVRLRTTDPGAILDEMSGRVAAAPHFFKRTGVCLDLSPLERVPTLAELRAVIDAVRRVGMLSIGVIGDAAGVEALAGAVDLPVLAAFRAPSRAVPAAEVAAESTVAVPLAAAEPAPGVAVSTAAAAMPAVPPPAVPDAGVPALMQTQMVRSGQRIYARHRDLVVTAAVAAGAEVMADGCLHVYGSLRGRAMAGARGDLTARVFCQEFHAELVSIAGVFRIFETMPAELAGKPVQVWLDGEALHCAPIGA